MGGVEGGSRLPDDPNALANTGEEFEDQFRKGVDVEDLATTYGLTKSEIATAVAAHADRQKKRGW